MRLRQTIFRPLALPAALAPALIAALIAAPVAFGASVIGATSAAAQTQPATEADEPAALLADSVQITGRQTIIARGNVEVLHKGTRLRAQAISYDGTTESLSIQGPIYLVDGDDLVLVANSAGLDRDLQNGILSGARLVLNQQLQIASVEANRVNGRYTQLYKTVASACQVCTDRPVPLWQIRAEEIVHDQKTRQIYFRNAQFRVADIPVFYLPRLRLPDPTLKRSTGFLVPSIRTTNLLGTGIKIPYFIAIGQDKDLTLTPYLTTTGSRTLEARYRQAFTWGGIEVEGAYTDDDLRPAEGSRGYLFAEGNANLPNGFKLTFDLEKVSDPEYLLNYGYPDKDRLDSEVKITRTRRDQHINLRVVEFESLRVNEDNSLLPTLVGDVDYHKRFTPALIGGQANLQFNLHGHYRESDADKVGRDVQRTSARLDWKRSWTLNNGMVAALHGRAAADLYGIFQDSRFEREKLRTAAFGAVELRWPLERQTARARHLLEPVAQLVWSPVSSTNVPNEDSVLVEFDEGNLFSLGRFPGYDAYEQGTRLNLGLSWTRFGAGGWSTGVTVGRVIRAKGLGQFTKGSGLKGSISDWLVTTRIGSLGGLSLVNRAVFGDDLTPAKNELRLYYATPRVDVSASYIWLESDPAEARPTDTSELALDSRLDLSRHWVASSELRYNFDANRPSLAAIGVGYRNECVTIDLSVSHRYASTTNISGNTDFGVKVSLNGFGAKNDGRAYRRSCMQ